MRTLKIFLVFVAVILSGFSKDSLRPDRGVTVPFRFDGMIITNPSSGWTVCTPPADPSKTIAHARTGWIQGNQSHGGRLITELSEYTISSCNTDFATGINTAFINGVCTVANGDSYTYTCTMKVNILTGEIILYLTVTGGTGRFNNAAGQATLTGIHTDTGKHPISGWGSLTFAK